MIRQVIELNRQGWRVVAMFAVTRHDVDDVMDELFGIGCDGRFAKQAWENMNSGKINTGLTYTNYFRRCSVVVVGETSGADEFLNSLVHETHHLVAHIGKALGLDTMGEEVCYLHGELVRMMFPECHELLCDRCRGKMED
jgi:hypothetical protein